MNTFTQYAGAAVARYGYLLNILRSQAETSFRRGGAGMDDGREQAVSVAQGAARSFLSTEHAQLNDDTQTVALDAWQQAQSDLGLSQRSIEDRFAEFIFSAAQYTLRVIAAQAERDVMAMAQHIHTTNMRIDLYQRLGRHTRTSAAAAVMIENSQVPAFRFMDRMGRQFKATKHIRDIYRQHLMNIYNEVYMSAVAQHGQSVVHVAHPDPNYKWQGQPLAIIASRDAIPLYYDMRSEIFHPSSEATLTLQAA